MTIAEEAEARQLTGTFGGKTRAVYRPLGAYRFGLAMLVVVGHLLQALAPPGGSEWFKLPYGTVGVMSFFVASGYIITEAASAFYQGKAGGFLVARLIRIFAPYLFALVITSLMIGLLAFLQASGAALHQDWSAGSYILTTCMPWNLVAPLDYSIVLAAEPCFVIVRYIWAIAVELQFYFVVAVVLALGRHFGHTRTALVAGSIAVALYLAGRLNGFAPVHAITFAPYFLAGSAAYALRDSAFRLPLVLIGVGWVTFDLWEKVQGGALPMATTALMAVSMLVFFALCFQGTPSPIKKADEFAGNLSYPIYLNHYAVEIAFAALLGTGWLWLSGAIVTVLGISTVAFFVVEPMIKPIRDKLRGATL